MGKDVRIEWNKQDRYGRYVAKVWVTPVSHPCTTTGEPYPVARRIWREGPKDGPITKADKSGICHTLESPSYQALKHFQAFPSLEACLASGGRPLK